MILAGIGAVAVFVLVVSYVGQVRAQVGNRRPVLQLTEDVPANRTLTQDMVTRTQVPAKWTPRTVVRDLSEVQGTVTATKLSAGAFLQRGMLIPAPALEPGQREIAIMINAETGVAGKIEPGSVVDIYATFQGTEDSCSVRVMSSVRVISVGELQTQEGEGGASQVVPLTFALDSQAINRLMYAEAFSTTLRLARVGTGSTDSAPPVDPVCKTPKTGDEGSSEAGAPSAQESGGVAPGDSPESGSDIEGRRS